MQIAIAVMQISEEKSPTAWLRILIKQQLISFQWDTKPPFQPYSGTMKVFLKHTAFNLDTE
jgi:hypothetical protein